MRDAGTPDLFDTEPFETPLPKAASARIAEVAFPVPLHHAFSYLVPDGLHPKPGCRVRASFGPRLLTGVVLRVFEGVPERKLKPLGVLVDHEPILPEELLECARWMAGRYGAPIGECLKTVLPPFLKDGDEPAPPPPAGVPGAPKTFELTPSQARAVDWLSARLRERRGGAVLVYGVPASGKTEVYLRLIRQVVSTGGQALFLLPEISLTRPFFEEFQRDLGVPVALWHSQLGAALRRKTWLGLRRGDIKVVVGARSASLLPFADLRLSILDEEHDESFKQEGQSPLYHARDVALHRGRSSNALVLLGSATPSLEAWAAARDGSVEMLEMPDRVSRLSRPTVRTVAVPMGRCLSEELLASLKLRLERKEQSILLVNRRGFTTLLMCAKCGWVSRCADCGVAKIQHEKPDGSFELRCHHCEAHEPLPQACGDCGSGPLRVLGTGTQKVVAELKKVLPQARVIRMDRDTALAERKADKRAYERFKAGEADILVGTKLVAKSFHFPDVTLVGVVDADTMIHMPEFRSSERTMQLLAQVAGRSGRAEKPGEVVLQTLNPQHIAIAGAAQGDYGSFAARELSLRRELGYPPYSMLIRLVFLCANEERVAEEAGKACELLRAELSPSGHEVVGPAPAVVPKQRGLFRYHALVKVADPATTLEPLVARLLRLELPSTVRIKLNVDPYDLF